MKLEAGKTYVARNGDIVGPMEKCEDAFTFDGVVWMPDGVRWMLDEDRDLIAEHTPQPKDPTATYHIAYIAALAAGADDQHARDIAEAIDKAVG